MDRDVIDKAKALQADIRDSRLQVAGAPRLIRPLLRRALLSLAAVAAWVERQARHS